MERNKSESFPQQEEPSIVLKPCSVIEYYSCVQRKKLMVKSSKKYRLRVYESPKSFVFIRISEIQTEAFRKIFELWMKDKLQPTIPGLEPQDACYFTDWDHFLRCCSGGTFSVC